MEQSTTRNLRLGLFVSLGTLLLIVAFYFVGSKQNLFGSTFRLQARFYNVNGLMAGNNVRFAGIDVGTVESLEIINDSTVLVTLILDKRVQPHISTGAIASVGTDGLMGNKLVNLNAGPAGVPGVKDGSELKTLRPLETDEMVRTLNVTNTNMANISSDLSNITGRISNKNSFWKLLMDTLVAEHIKTTIINLKDVSADTRTVAGRLEQLSGLAVNDKSSIHKFVSDTILYRKVVETVDQLQKTGDSARSISASLAQLIQNVKEGKGSAGQALKDTMLIYRLNRSLQSIDSGAGNFNQDMIALQHTWPLKKYFRKRAKKK